MTDAHDRRTLEERLQWIADWSEPGIDLADAGTAREALDRIKAQDAEIERLKRRADFVAAVAYDCGHSSGVALAERMAETFPIGTPVRKVSGPQWQGVVVGYYSSSFTPEGLVIECTAEGARGQVHVEPAKRMERL